MQEEVELGGGGYVVKRLHAVIILRSALEDDFQVDRYLGWQSLGIEAPIGQLAQVDLPAWGVRFVAPKPGKQAVDG